MCYFTGLEGESFWISGSDDVVEGTWVFDSGAPVPRGTPFMSAVIGAQEPNILGNIEHCLALYHAAEFYMNGRPCDMVTRALCEKPISVTNEGKIVFIAMYMSIWYSSY